jgi:uncharacterized protein (DUF1778 family)
MSQDCKSSKQPQTRINVKIPSDLHRSLKATLALLGKTLRQWVIEAARRETKTGKATSHKKVAAR